MKLVIISNEKFSKKKSSFFCDNIDMKSIPEGLSKSFETLVIAKSSKVNKSYQTNFKKINISSNIITYLFSIYQTFKNNKTNYLLVSITPYTFFSYLLLFLFRKNIFIYLRSNGYEELRVILGYLGPVIYGIMYKTITFKSTIITCQKKLVEKKKYQLVFPSELESVWFKNNNRPQIKKPRLLYVGRIKIEKGIFSLIKILKETKQDVKLSIAGKDIDQRIDNKKIILLGFKNKVSSLIKTYDSHNITILPSFTEAHPKVIDESLARLRPVIIFNEIRHVVQNRHGIFVSKRNAKSLTMNIKFILKNYLNIRKKMKKNILPTRKNFIHQLVEILN